MKRIAALTCAAILMGACRTGVDYSGTAEPRYAGGPAVSDSVSRRTHDTLRLATFNIAFAREIDSALAVIAAEPDLRHADVLMLQEMDAPGTRRIADALGMWYVYYPAIFHKRSKRDFGNAVLARWPIVEDAKVVLPHPSRYAGTHRIATAATIRVGERSVRVYSTHLGTLADVGRTGRRAQMRAIIDDAKRYDVAVIGGDMNQGDWGAVALEAGYAWPTEQGPRTNMLGRWDHIFIKGSSPGDIVRAGTVSNVRKASDHRPVWVSVLMR